MRHVVGGDGAEQVVAGSERLIYENTLGRLSFRFPEGFLASDDISTTARTGCKLSHYEFEVTGRGDPGLPGGPYSVSFALYEQCPGAWRLDDRESLIIPGTAGEISFADAGPRTIVFVVPPDAEVTLPTNFWLGMSFVGENASMILGAPAMEGFSADLFDFPGFACNSSLGGFPTRPHASFNARFYGRDDCGGSHVGYKAARLMGVPFKGGRNRWFSDDLQLIVEDCDLVAYEVAVLDPALYSFELRYSACGGPIAGTRTTQIVGADWRSKRRLIRKKVAFICDENSPEEGRGCFQDSDCQDETHPDGDCLDPIPLPQNVWFATMINNDNGSAIAAGRQADIGFTQDLYARCSYYGTVELANLGEGIHSAFHISITCDGEAPKGACCDMYVTECAGGSDDGRPCGDNDDCEAPGACESTCREVGRVNCPFPQPGIEYQPQWVEGGVCDPDPFPYPCGQAACCTPDDTCLNLTKNECDAVPPVEAPHQWQIGRYCGELYQQCPFAVCLAREGDCTFAHEGPGCRAYYCYGGSYCCHDVCEVDPWCCRVVWDRTCVEVADEVCQCSVEHYECWSPRDASSALLVDANSSTFFTNRWARDFESDPGFCCHRETPGATGFGTVWFKFVATHASAEISAYGSDALADPLIQVFSAEDPSTNESACNTLTPIACGSRGSDSAESEGAGVCVGDLTPGETYYVMFASKTPEAKGLHQLGLVSPCQEGPLWAPDDCNENGAPDGCDVGSGASPDCNVNGIPDECDIADGSSADCDGNGVLDQCDIASGNADDCQQNGVPDVCDLRDGTAFDCDDDGLPDVCRELAERLRGPKTSASFGSSVALAGEVLAIGDASRGSTNGAGRVHLLQRSNAVWVPDAIVEIPGPPWWTGFGRSIDTDGAVLVVGAPNEEVDDESGAGAVYIVRKEGGEWVSEQRLTASDPGRARGFGAAVVLGDDFAIVGSPSFRPTGGWQPPPVEGSVYIFRRAESRWNQELALTAADGHMANLFGSAVAFLDATLFVGAPWADCGQVEGAGAVYVFRRIGNKWHPEAKITSPAPLSGELFGIDVSASAGCLAIGAPGHRVAGGPAVGRVYVARSNGRSWPVEAQLDPETTLGGALTGFGVVVAMHGETVVAGPVHPFRDNPVVVPEKPCCGPADAAATDCAG